MKMTVHVQCFSVDRSALRSSTSIYRCEFHLMTVFPIFSIESIVY